MDAKSNVSIPTIRSVHNYRWRPARRAMALRRRLDISRIGEKSPLQSSRPALIRVVGQLA